MTFPTTPADKTLIDFNDQGAGTIIDGQYSVDGVTISSINHDGSIDSQNPPMIFDSACPTGGDWDLATSNLGKVLILSEDRDSHDPDDNASGGIFKFDFDGDVTVHSLTLLDVEEGASIKVYDEHSNLLKEVDIYTSNNGQYVADISVDDAAYMTIELCGSGAVDNLSFTKGPALDGVVNGTGGDDLINLVYVDAQGDRIDNNDALGVEGTTGDEDLVLAGAGNDTVYAGAADDIVRGESGDDVLDGGAGNDVLEGGDGDDEIDGGVGNDRIEGGDGADTIRGGDGDDLIVGFDSVSIKDGDTTVMEDDGADDLLIGGFGDDTILGGDGDDTIRGDDEFGNCPTGASTYFEEWAQDISNVVFYFDTDGDGVFDVQVKVDDFPDDGSGTFISNDLDDFYGQLAAFAADGGSVPSDATVLGVSIKGGTQPTKYFAVDGNANGELPDPGPTNNTGPGNDAELSYGDFFSTYDPAASNGSGSETFNDLIDGANGADLIFGDKGDDTIFGGAGDDTIDGGIGNDLIDGGTGNDLIEGGDGNDTIDGGSGGDTLHGGAGEDQIEGGTGNDSITGGDGNDTIRGNGGDDTLDGGAGDDSVSGSANDDLLFGSDGNDEVFGSGGNDTLDGGAGDDEVRGGKGEDRVSGGDGNDTVTGSDGNDTIDGGDGADTIDGGDDRDLILGATTGDMIDGGSGGDDFDTLDLTGSDVAFIDYDPENVENGVVNFRDGTTAQFEDIEAVIPCFTPGTLIATPKGEVAVEALQVGDRVITRDNGIQLIRWVGKRDMTAAELSQNGALRAVMIGKGALGHGLPERDMVVSPQHRVLIANDETMLYFDEREVLVAAKHLVGRPGVERMGATDITYHHVMFDNHEVILSDGAWTESFQPGDHSLKGLGKAQREEIFAIFPELREHEGREGYPAARRMLKRREAEFLVR
ncbi:Ca2+-binding protein, RTX toxin-related [Jannaschia faecimaris]|uniref:Ca2+-binding protein, RTX toxin-related n=1 Tax=Jannaschia faecimaris TaxID=1244108 RepID=A0A1H3NZA5_9RHOB|nr:Hint domain-containing protein [Jannaschia faecimaris]SDY94207.1 Ca2+-binding protein, RTX toxin-related [Jannaschia faecimaris]